MTSPTLIDTRDELRANTVRFANEVPALAAKASSISKAIGNGCSHAVEWVAFQDYDGNWKVSFSKFAGYNGLTFKTYDQLRQINLTGTDTKRRIEKLGGTYYGVGVDSGLSFDHPSVGAVKEMCSLFGKTPKRTAKVRVFPIENRPVAMNILVAAIRAANLKNEELKQIISEVMTAA